MLREGDHHLGLTARLAAAITDRRDPDLIKHLAEVVLRQRIFGLALAQEDLNDHQKLRHVGRCGFWPSDRPPRRAGLHPIPAAPTAGFR